jgi:hypothetical protein
MEQQFLKLFSSQSNSISHCYLGNNMKDVILRHSFNLSNKITGVKYILSDYVPREIKPHASATARCKNDNKKNSIH